MTHYIQHPQVLFELALNSVHAAMPHLSRAEIANPPHGWFDAQLARQIAVHITVRGLNVPQRWIAQMQKRRRGTICHAVRVVDERIIASPSFAHACHGMTRAAQTAAALQELAGAAARQMGMGSPDRITFSRIVPAATAGMTGSGGSRPGSPSAAANPIQGA